MRSSSFLPALLFASLAACGPLTMGCDATQDGPEPNMPSPAPLPVWQGALAHQFDDSIETEWLNTGATSSPDADRLFGLRAQAADYLLRVKVISTTTQGVGNMQGYRLTLRVIGQPFGGARPPSDTLDVVIRPDSPAFAAVRAQDVRLTGRTFLGLFKGFSAAGAATADMHWCLVGETREVMGAAHRARLLSEVGYLVRTPLQ